MSEEVTPRTLKSGRWWSYAGKMYQLQYSKTEGLDHWIVLDDKDQLLANVDFFGPSGMEVYWLSFGKIYKAFLNYKKIMHDPIPA